MFDKMYPLQFLNNILNAAGKSAKIFHIHGSFGDVYFQCSAIKEAQEKYQNICVIIDEKYKNLANDTFAEIPKVKIILFEGATAHKMFSQISILGNKHEFPVRLLPTIYPMVGESIATGLLSYTGFLRLLTESDKVGPLEKIEQQQINLKKAFQILAQANVPPGNTVLISADNNTQVEFSEEFWQQICEVIRSCGWVPCLNASGTFVPARILAQSGLPKVVVPPNLAVSIPTAAGCYIGGTNGFSTIQALYNDRVEGIHLINGNFIQKNKISDKFGLNYKVELFFHKNMFKHEFLGLQKEILVQKNEVDDELAAEIASTLQKMRSKIKARPMS